MCLISCKLYIKMLLPMRKLQDNFIDLQSHEDATYINNIKPNDRWTFLVNWERLHSTKTRKSVNIFFYYERVFNTFNAMGLCQKKCTQNIVNQRNKYIKTNIRCNTQSINNTFSFVYLISSVIVVFYYKTHIHSYKSKKTCAYFNHCKA